MMGKQSISVMILTTLCMALVWGCTAGASDEGPKPSTLPPAFIVIDQFGYAPGSEKIAILRDPVIGADSALEFTPSAQIDVVNADSDAVVYTMTAKPWNDSAVDDLSGDRIWHADFSAVTQSGRYKIIDRGSNIASAPFNIQNNVYRPVFVEAVRNLYYQRAGFDKTPPNIGQPWAHPASHMQDKTARRFMDKSNMATARDLHGGWYDAGDYNQYTTWTSNYIVSLLLGYNERPSIYTDDFNIPESGNGIPDILDEVSWGAQWLARMQNEDGSLLSVLSRAEASPPSATSEPSYYGDPSTSATLSGAAAFAMTAYTFEGSGSDDMRAIGSDFRQRAVHAWEWAQANPDVTFRNNDEAAGTKGLAAGQQEVDAERRAQIRMKAAIYIFALTGEEQYHAVIRKNYQSYKVFQDNYMNDFRGSDYDDLLFYASLPNADNTISKRIISALTPPRNDSAGAYLSPIGAYTWGSNSSLSRAGALRSHPLTRTPDSLEAGAHYLHTIHGANPLGLVYLSAMEEFGATTSVSTFYHAWFANGNPDFDQRGVSPYGPLSGYLVGGPNPYYDRAACCPDDCGKEGNKMCVFAPMTPPHGEPPMKAYAEFNEGWPFNGWEVTENSLGYQSAYIRLLARYVD